MPAPQVHNAVHVHIDADALDASPRRRQAEVRHLRPDARERHQPLGRVRYVARVAVAQDRRGRLDVLGLVVVEAHAPDHVVQRVGVDGEDVLEGQAGGGVRGARGQVRLQIAHREVVRRVLGLRGQHERDERLEALVARRGRLERQRVAAHGVDGGVARGALRAHLLDQVVYPLPV